MIHHTAPGFIVRVLLAVYEVHPRYHWQHPDLLRCILCCSFHPSHPRPYHQPRISLRVHHAASLRDSHLIHSICSAFFLRCVSYSFHLPRNRLLWLLQALKRVPSTLLNSIVPVRSCLITSLGLLYKEGRVNSTLTMITLSGHRARVAMQA
jgi:hypothetical protein